MSLMVRSFAITTPSPSLRLKAPGQGKHAFTVTNASGRLTLRRRLRVDESLPRKEEYDVYVRERMSASPSPKGRGPG